MTATAIGSVATTERVGRLVVGPTDLPVGLSAGRRPSAFSAAEESAVEVTGGARGRENGPSGRNGPLPPLAALEKLNFHIVADYQIGSLKECDGEREMEIIFKTRIPDKDDVEGVKYMLRSS